MWRYIRLDMMSTSRYLLISFIFVCLFALLYILFAEILGFAVRWSRLFLFFVFGIYFMTMIQITYLSREPGSRIGVDFRFLGTWGTDAVSHAYVIENILMFFPFGIFAPFLWNRLKSPWVLLLTSLIVSITIEAAQYITQRGYCQLDDVVMNVVGGLLGYIVFFLLDLIRKKK